MDITADDKQKIQNYYSSCLSTFGPNNSASLSWSSKDAQEVRFKILSRVGDLNGKTVLDVGCGLGDLYNYLITHGINIDYTGIDLVPDMVIKAKEKYPGAKFANKNLENFSAQSFDYVLASGIFSYKIENYREKYFALIKKIFAVAKIAVAINLLDSNGPSKGDLLVTYEPEEIKQFCRTITPNVKIIKGYASDDFTVYLYR